MRYRYATLYALTLLTGATDAIAFLSLGGVFTSVMTGNLVLLGVGIGRGALSATTHTLVALAGYVLGAVTGGAVVGSARGGALWPREVTACLGAELGLYAVYAGAWWATGSHPSSAQSSALLLVLASALGVQSSAVLRLGIPGFSTTYLTGTLTVVMSSLATNRSVRGVERAIACLASLVAGATAGAAVVTWQPALGPLVPLGLVAFAFAVALAVLNRLDARPPAAGLTPTASAG